MIITRTPFRISFAGGGSDLKEYYTRHTGGVLSCTIDKYIYLSMHPYFHKNKYLLKYLKNEHVDDVEKIEHRIIRQVFRDYQIRGVDFNSSADIPAGTGLGSSSAFTVGITNLCNTFTGRFMSKEDIARYACEVEIEKLGEPIGKQDQYACAIGGLNFINFNPDDTVTTEKLYLTTEKFSKLQTNLIMFYTGESRSAGSILSEQKKNMTDDAGKIKNMQKMVKLAEVLKDELMRGNIDSMGEVLHESWHLKKEMASSISNKNIDNYYDTAIKNGAIGGKLLGAGGGGFLLFYVKEDKREDVLRAMKDLYMLDFKFDMLGTTVIYYD